MRKTRGKYFALAVSSMNDEVAMVRFMLGSQHKPNTSVDYPALAHSNAPFSRQKRRPPQAIV
ncbi:hypothetical protein [Mesorhizobium marinum]|uniref:hypothetical protein n=1 Tax=Mesorhizobium marinum TaxID=3228790 RepID=UPI00346742A0